MLEISQISITNSVWKIPIHNYSHYPRGQWVKMALFKDLSIRTTEMHTGGEPVRIVTSGFPQILGSSLLEKVI